MHIYISSDIRTARKKEEPAAATASITAAALVAEWVRGMSKAF